MSCTLILAPPLTPATTVVHMQCTKLHESQLLLHLLCPDRCDYYVSVCRPSVHHDCTYVRAICNSVGQAQVHAYEHRSFACTWATAKALVIWHLDLLRIYLVLCHCRSDRWRVTEQVHRSIDKSFPNAVFFTGSPYATYDRINKVDDLYLL